jgi:hypothetical protein
MSMQNSRWNTTNTLTFVRPLLVSSVGRSFVEKGWMDDETLDHVMVDARRRLAEQDPKKAALPSVALVKTSLVIAILKCHNNDIFSPSFHFCYSCHSVMNQSLVHVLPRHPCITSRYHDSCF